VSLWASLGDVASNGAVSSLLGALVGGGGTYAATRSQTTRVLEAQRQDARLEREEERAAERRARSETVVWGLLEALALLEDAIPVLWSLRFPRFGRSEYDELADRAGVALDELRRCQVVMIPWLDEPRLGRLWDQLRRLCQELQTVESRQQFQGAGSGQDPLIGRAGDDVTGYLRYVRACLEAWIGHESLPPWLLPPNLRRAPDQGASWDMGDELDRLAREG
jgi:hypothetical protein